MSDATCGAVGAVRRAPDEAWGARARSLLGPARGSRVRRRALGAAKVAVSAVLVWLLLRDVALGEVVASVSRARPALVVAAFALYPIGYAISLTRWRLLLRARGVAAPLPFLTRSYMTAVFFSNLLPSTIGGDAIRAYDSWRLGAGKAEAASIIVADRLLGFLALIAFALAGLLAADEVRERLPALELLLLALLATIGVALWIFLGAGRRWVRRLCRSERAAPLRRLLEAVRRAQQSFDEIRRQPGLVLRCFGLSLLLQANVVAFWILLAAALRLEVSALYLLAVVPLTTVLMMIPVTVNGIGIRENALVFFLGLVAVGAPAALALAWTAYGLQLLQAIPGGIVYMLFRRGPRARPAGR